MRVAKYAEGDANFKLADVPKGREAGSDFTVNGLASTLGRPAFDDVVPAKDAPPGDTVLQARFATFDGLVVDVTAWEKDGKDYARFTPRSTAQAEKSIAAAQAKAKADSRRARPASAKDAKTDDAPIKPPRSAIRPRIATEARCAQQGSRRPQRGFKDWTYVLPPYKYANMDKKLDDLLKPVEDKKPVEAASTAASAKAGKAGR